MKSGESKPALFPTPYPDELFYSVLCRYKLRVCGASTRSVSEELYGKRKDFNVLLPQFIDRIASLLPCHSGLTSEYFIQHTTLYPYFSPFLINKRRDVFLLYMNSMEATGYFALGFGKQRQPRNENFKFCKSCWVEDIAKFGEPYWHRLHQLPGILVCHLHGEPLFEAPVSFLNGSKELYPASNDIIYTAEPYKISNIHTFEKLLLLSADTAWLLQNGSGLDSYEKTLNNYDRWFRSTGYRVWQGKTFHKKIQVAVWEYFGEDLLRTLNAYDESRHELWIARITNFPRSPLHPIYHILMARFLSGSIKSFFEQDLADLLPFGHAPWPCHNPVCSGYLEDVIDKFDANPYSGYMHARFECPICGMVYRRKKSMQKKEQYIRRPKIFDYGPLWNDFLKQCLVEKKMTARETARLMKCDFYTVNRHAFEMGITPIDGVHLIEKLKKEKIPDFSNNVPLSDDEFRKKYRRRWLDLIRNNPGIIRSRLMELDYACHLWLRKNDLSWYEENSPQARYANFNWDARDAEILEKVELAVKRLCESNGRPQWISRHAVTIATGCHQLSNKKTLSLLPRTATFLDNNLESAEEWRKRKIVWAIKDLCEQDVRVTLNSIAIRAAISEQYFKSLIQFVLECLDLE